MFQINHALMKIFTSTLYLASRPWLLVSGFALIYHLRFWFKYHFPEAALPGGLNGLVSVWFKSPSVTVPPSRSSDGGDVGIPPP
jgi:hypothetical protein